MTADVRGAVAPTHRRILTIALPVVISNATVPILGAVDTGVIGQLGQAAPIGAVGLGAVILSSVYWIFGFLRMGTTGLTGQALGAGDRDEADALLSRALLVSAAAGLGIIALQWAIFAGAFFLAPASAEVEALARTYMSIRVLSAPAAIAIYGITGWLIADERTGGMLALQLLANGMNIVLSILFVLGLGYGVGGVATATVISEWSALGLGLWLCRGTFAGRGWRDPVRVFDRVRLRAMAAVNGDIMIRTVLLQAIFTSFLFLGAGFGDVPLAANQILLQFLYITAFALDGFAFAAEALVGQAMGARRRDNLRRAAVLTMTWGMGVGAGMAAIFALTGPLVIDVMTTAPGVREAARDLLPWMVAAPVVGVAAWMLDGIFIGATRSRDMRNMMVISAAVYGVAVLLLIPAWGNHGLWAALLISFVARGVTLGARYPRLEAAAA